MLIKSLLRQGFGYKVVSGLALPRLALAVLQELTHRAPSGAVVRFRSAGVWFRMRRSCDRM